MAIGVYGNIKGATVNPNDIDVLYCYSSDFTTENSFDWTRINSTELFSKNYDPDNTNLPIQGSYTMSIPTSLITNKGYYSFYIQPKSFQATIIDCGLLSGRNIKGIVLDINNIDSYGKTFFTNNSLKGFRIDYLSSQENLEENLFRIITSNNFVEPTVENLNTTSNKAIRYKISNASSNLQFLTVSPSSNGSVRANTNLFIGEVGQKILLTNTFFDPQQIDIQVVENDIDTLSWVLCGPQTKDCNTGVRSYYNDEDEVFKQVTEYVYEENGNKIEVRRDGTDATQYDLNDLN